VAQDVQMMTRDKSKAKVAKDSDKIIGFCRKGAKVVKSTVEPMSKQVWVVKIPFANITYRRLAECPLSRSNTGAWSATPRSGRSINVEGSR
jgi:hypothetical protein